MKILDVILSLRYKTDKESVLIARIFGVVILLVEIFFLSSPIFFDLTEEAIQYVNGFREYSVEIFVLVIFLTVGLEAKEDVGRRENESSL